MNDYLDIQTMKEYVDPDGVRWTRRGNPIVGKALERRTRHAEVVVHHHRVGQFSEIPADERTEFWSAARQRMASSRLSTFIGAEFKDDSGRHLVLIDEGC